MKRRYWFLAALVPLVLMSVSAANQAPQQSPAAEFMKRKLQHAQQVLEGLALEDFPKIKSNAQALTALSQAASWQVYQTPQYLEFSTEFARLTEKLAAAATDENIDGATLAYVQITVNCVSCHQYVRRVKMADATADFPH